MSKDTRIRPVWFLPRTRDRPPVAAITLGDIIASPADPEDHINTTDPPPVPARLIRKPEDEAPWNWTKEFARSSSGGLFASFMQIAGIGGEINITAESKHAEIYDAERMVTEYFVPSARYIEDSLADLAVRNALTGPNRKKRLYMITGLKTAYGATLAIRTMQERGIHAQFGADLTALGAPVTVGPKLGFLKSESDELNAGKKNFVFGFKLRVLRYKKDQVVHESYEKGALHGVDEEGGSVVGVEAEGERLSGDFDLQVDEVTSADFDMASKVIVAEDGEEVDYMLP
ncbi:hypothetical protein LTR56_011607 [Elasticomyces elasticus]|nr:hypothetical protein LTR56_011607 [Elasticomyces elasticus]KAK3656964.1 hypothetical protein LTR22_009465 [Elasticomyces elasticus]KAK4908172.1 hypothetical protein LTR49_022898 [Elasticomyces elasticus]KAK5748150.1 hypothetical protein LTS12_021799 [Elasticomyces elasticus]